MRAPTRLAKWLGTQMVFVLLIFTGIFTLSARDVTDPDVWWHLKTGQLIFQNHAIPRTDPFSFTRQGQPWTTHEWLTELLVYGVYRLSGWAGLILFFSLMTTAGFLFLYLRCVRRPYVAGLVVLWGAFACRPTWGVRPQTISVLLASLLLWLLERSEQNPRRLWWIVPLILVWANLHAGYVLGIVLMLLFLIGGWLDRLLGFESRNASSGITQTLARVFIASVLVVAINPNGFRLYSYPFETFASQAMQAQIAEWLSPNFHRGEHAPFLLMLLGIFVVISLAAPAFRPRQMLLLCAGLYAALHSIRNVPIFVLVAAPPMVSGVSNLLGDRAESDPRPNASIGRTLFHMSILVLVGAFAWSQTALVIHRQKATEDREFPSAAASFLLKNHPTGPIFNYYNWGGYLIWRLSPEYRVFIDGRADLYGDKFLQEFSDAYTLTGNWKAPLQRWAIRTVVIPVSSPLAAALQVSPGWKVVFRDDQALVLTNQGLDGAGPRGNATPTPSETLFLPEYATN